MAVTMTPDVIIDHASEVFAADRREPPALTLRGASDIDSYDSPAPFDPSLDESTDAYIERFAWSALPHLDPRSWRHYLPSLISYALRRRDDPAMAAEGLIRSLRPPDRFPPRLRSLTARQESVVREFLEAVALTHTDATLQEEAQQALEEWWLPNPRARPTAEEMAALRTAPVICRTVSADVYCLEVPDTLPGSGLRDLPTESRRVQTWGGYVCGDVHMLVAVNAVSCTVRSFDDTVSLYSTFFGVPPLAHPVDVAGAHRAVRVSGLTPVVSSAGAELLVMIVADAGDIVTLTIRAAERDDVAAVIERMARSFVIVANRR